ncbi:MAG: zinc-ribbon domain-containing protein [Candidatus Aenigmarchaeota archaeon]|nr:zinc-ribbon domain-containing protein [Candidatus Aenigmarchaeota archaeon]
MNCPVCGTRIEKEWGFCPRCGTRISGDFFDEIFSRMRKELAEMNKLLEKDIEAFDLSPWFKDMDKKASLHPKRSGFTIKIVRAGNRQPDVSVRTFGDVDKSKLKKEIDELGAWQPGIEKEAAFRQGSGKPAKPQEKLVIKRPMKTEEPKTSVARSASKVVVSIQLPGVESANDIEVSELENSVEVKALAQDKAYFKILTKPSQFRLSKKSFEKGVLQMEFS